MNTRSIRFRLTVWYAGLLAGMLVLFGASVYLGLSHYLEWTLKEALSQQAKQIGESWLGEVGVSGESYVAGEINEHVSPKVNDRFIRITRADGSVMYLSDEPESKRFDPSRVPPLKAQSGQESLREAHLTADSELMIFALPFSANNGGGYVIEVGASNREIERVLHGLLLAIAIGLPVIVAIAIAGGYLLMRRALRPVDEITQSAERITSRNLSERLPVAETGDEIERLSVGLNRMIARLDESFQHIHRFSADASHELRTPLTILRGELEAAVQQPKIAPELRETLGSALEETERLSRIVENLMAIARLDAGEAKVEFAQFDLAELTSGTTEQMRLLAEDKSVGLLCEAERQVRVEGDRARLKQVIVNLVDNAIKYTPAGGLVGVKVWTSDGHAVLEVSDNGVGIPPEAAPHIFERFYRVDKARSRQMGGAGLGLSIIKAIVTAHGGQVKVESVEGKRRRADSLQSISMTKSCTRSRTKPSRTQAKWACGQKPIRRHISMTCESSLDSSFKSTIISEGESMKKLTRREAMGTIITAGAGVTLAGMTEAEAQTPAAPAFRGQHQPKPLPFDAAKLNGISEKLIKSHWENNYSGAVKALNAVEQRLAAMLADKDLPPYVYGDLKREELVRTGSVVLHEHYFANLGGDGKAGDVVLVAIKQHWGSYEQWEAEFKKTGAALGGGSGWVIFAHNFHTDELHNYWSWDHMHNAPFSRPLLVLDMYEHAYHMDYGAAAAKYVDAFMQNVNWEEVNRRFTSSQKALATLR